MTPIRMTYNGGGLFLADPKMVKACEDQFGVGEVLTMAPVEERSRRSHDHFFARMDEIWQTLHERLKDRYPNADTFRRTALISTGHCDTDTTVCASNAEALRLRAVAKRLAPDSIATVRGAVVTIYTAHSQSVKAMGKETFQRSKDDCLGWAEAQVSGGQGGAGANNPRAEAA